MMACMHTRIEPAGERRDDMHCEGWRCLDCDAYLHGGCHPRSWCAEVFCGPEPAPADVPAAGVAAASP